jgi:hypothetical protein
MNLFSLFFDTLFNALTFFFCAFFLQLGNNGIGTRNSNAPTRLLLGIGDLAVVNDNSVAAGTGRGHEPANAGAKLELIIRSKDLTQFHIHWLVFDLKAEKGKRGERRGENTYDKIILDSIGLAPGRHDKGVIARNHNHLVDALGLELVYLAGKGRNVVCLAGRGEGTGDGDEDDFFVFEFCAPTSEQTR